MSEIDPSNYRISLKEQNPEWASTITSQEKLSPLTARILAARGIKDAAATQRFLNPSIVEQLPNLSEVIGMNAACELLAQKPKAKIAICCDYDVDGLTSGALLSDNLGRLGYDCQVYVPNRFTEGYGLNSAMIERCLADNCQVLLAVDYGTSNVAEIAFLKKQNIATIIIDHHQLAEEVPEADAFINPNQAGCILADEQLCSAGLSWCFLTALHARLQKPWQQMEQLDLVALATICDMVPLRGLNRAIASHGIKALNESKRAGITAIKELCGLNQVSCGNVGFSIGPRINAAGRMADGQTVIELFSTTDFYKARTLAEKLERYNKRRQEIEESVKLDVIKALPIAGAGSPLPAAIVAAEDHFHTGVVGIVAQRLVELYNRPAAVMGKDGEMLKGSVRGFGGFDVHAALTHCSEHLIKFGGHKAAGGFSLTSDQFAAFKAKFEKYAEDFFTSAGHFKEIEADTQANLAEINPSAVRELEALAPFGLGHPAPRIYLQNLKVRSIETLKGKHLKLNLVSEREGLSANALMWNINKITGLKVNERINIVARPELNSFRNQINLQLQLMAVQLSE